MLSCISHWQAMEGHVPSAHSDTAKPSLHVFGTVQECGPARFPTGAAKNPKPFCLKACRNSMFILKSSANFIFQDHDSSRSSSMSDFPYFSSFTV